MVIAAAIPALIHAARLIGIWSGSVAGGGDRIAAGVDGFLLCAAILPILAPALGASLAGRRDARQLVFTLVLATALASIVSAALMLTLLSSIPGSMAAAARAHATLLSALVALALIGAWAAMLCRNPLDAAGITVTASVALTVGVLLLGPLTGDLAPWLVRGLLQVSPLVTSASAAGIDLYRTETMYQLSPLASLGFAYPSWSLACAMYLAAATLAFLGTTRAMGRPPSSLL